MSKVFSQYLNQEIELATVERLDNGKSLNIIMHDSLCDVIHNQIPADKGITYNYTPVLTTESHSVMLCTIADKAGRRVQEIGEATTPSLDSEIAKMYPALTASQRAFDRAAIKYLNLPGKVFSNTEITINDANNLAAEKSIPENKEPEKKVGITSTPVAEEEEDTYATAPINTEDNSSTQIEEIPVEHTSDVSEQQENQQEEEQPTETPAIENDMEITIGKYSKKPILLSELIAKAETDAKEMNWLMYIVENVHSKEPDKAKQLDAIKVYVESKK